MEGFNEEMISMKGFNGKKSTSLKGTILKDVKRKRVVFLKNKNKNIFLFKISKHKNMSTV